MSGTGILAACSVLLLLSAGREILASQPQLGEAAARVAIRARRRWGWVSRGVALLDVEERLVKAGLAGRLTPIAVLLARGVGALLGLLAALLAAPAAPGRLTWLLLGALPAAGFLVPDALLERAARQRRERVVAALPDALDQLAVTAASGRNAIAGLADIAAASDGPLPAELAIVVAEVAAGVPQEKALVALRRRVTGSELAAVVAAIERSRRYGSPLADQLRRQATALRVDQRRAVQERSARAAPKIQLVVALVLVPSVLLMIAAGLIANSDVLLAGY